MKNLNVRFPDHIFESLDDYCLRKAYSKNSVVVNSVIDFLNDNGYSLDMLDDHSDQKGEDMEERKAR